MPRTPQPFQIEALAELDQTELNTRLSNIQADFEALFQDNANAASFLADDLNTLLATLDDGYLTNEGGELTIVESPTAAGVDRVIETGTTRTIEDTFSVVVADYFAIEGTGTLIVEGDGVLAVL